MIDQLTREMKAAAKLLEFEHAAYLRDRIRKLQEADESSRRVTDGARSSGRA